MANKIISDHVKAHRRKHAWEKRSVCCFCYSVLLFVCIFLAFMLILVIIKPFH